MGDEVDDQKKARLTRSASMRVCTCRNLQHCTNMVFAMSLPGEEAVSRLETEQKKRPARMPWLQQEFPCIRIWVPVCSCLPCQYVEGSCGV